MPGSPGGLSIGEKSDGPPMGRAEAFMTFKSTEGMPANEKLMEAKAALKQSRGRRAELAAAVNGASQEIDAIKAQLGAKKAEREAAAVSAQDAEIIDEEEYSMIQTLKAVKGTYKQSHEAMRQAATANAELANAADESRQELLRQFDEWCANSLGDAGTPTIAATTGGGGGDDPMDEDEQFEQMQIAKVMAEEPESLAFVRARNAAHGRKARR